MCKVQMLRSLVKQRLTAAAEEIFGLFERTIAEYEEELSRSKEENERQRKLLDAVLNPQLPPQTADDQQLLSKKDVPPEQQGGSSSLDQEDPDPPQIKEEQEELWTSQEGEQLQGLEEDDITEFPFSPVPVKSEDDEEEPECSQLHQRQTGEMETEADGEDCGGPEPARNSDPDRHPEPDTDDKTGDSSVAEIEVSCDDWEETREPQSDLNSLNNDEVPVVDFQCAGEKPFSCSECGKSYGKKHHLKMHMVSHTGEKPFNCPVCNKAFTQSGGLRNHVRIHTGEKPFSCSICGKAFIEIGNLNRHKKSHTGEKPFNCSDCDKRFLRKTDLKRHELTHTGEKPFSCSVCGKRFIQKVQLTHHMTHHTGEKRFSCSVCNKRFALRSHFKKHACVGQSDQEDPEPPHIKEEPEDLWISQEGEQLQGLEEADITKFPFTPVPVKSEDDEEEPQSSQFYQRQIEELEAEADGEDCGGPEPAIGDSSDPETEVLWSPSNQYPYHQSGSTFLNNDEVPVSDATCSAGEKPFSCSECGKRFGLKRNLKRHMITHKGEKPFSCSICGKSFTQSRSLLKHMRIHMEEKPIHCVVCGKIYFREAHLKSHMITHTGEKRFSCSVCEQRFTWYSQLLNHQCVDHQLSQLHQDQSEENREAEPPAGVVDLDPLQNESVL